MNPISPARHRLLSLLLPLDPAAELEESMPLPGRFATGEEYLRGVREPVITAGLIVGMRKDERGRVASVTLLSQEGNRHVFSPEKVNVIMPSKQLVEGVVRGLEEKPHLIECLREEMREDFDLTTILLSHLLHETRERVSDTSQCIGCEGLNHQEDCPEWTLPL